MAMQVPVKRAGQRTTPQAPGQLQAAATQPPLAPSPSGGSRDRDSREKDTGTKEANEPQTPATGPGLWCATFTLVFQQPGV